jgi:hypothetical protein
MNPSDCGAPAGTHSDVENSVAELLAGYLLSAGHGEGPGTDGLTVADAVGALYHAEARAGRVPDFVELARRHPELAEGIEAFFGQMGHAEIHRR